MVNQRVLLKAGMKVADKARKPFFSAIKMGLVGNAQDIALIAYQASKAGRGGLLPSVVGQSLGVAAGLPIAGFAAVGLSLIPGIGTLTAAILGNALAGYADVRLGSSFIKQIRLFTGLHKRIRHLEMGGNYRDTESAQRQRFLAIQDMNSSMIPSRRYLGQEALLMHR
jgi:hypothetical protein